MTRRELRGGPISWMARNPVAANLLMAALLVSGVLSAFQIKKEVFPDFDLDMISIQVAYPGASPEEVERGILIAIEEQVRDLAGIKRVDSVAGEGMGRVVVELQTAENRERALMDVKNAVDRIVTFPQEAERPTVSLVQRKRGVMDLVLYGDISEKMLRELAENVRDRLLLLPGVSVVDLVGVRDYEISAEVSADTLRRYGLTLSGIADQIKRRAIEWPGGGIKAEGGEVLLRVDERRDVGSEFADIPIVYGNNSRPLRLGEIADIRDDFVDSDSYALFDEKRAVLLSIYSLGDESPADVALTVRSFAEDLEQSLPPTIGTAIWNDRAQYFIGRLNLLLKNSAIGLALVLVLLGLLLEPKLAVWVALGIPISFMGSFFFLPAFGISLNMISMFAFMVTLGMVVDDAIVVGENIYFLRKKGYSAIRASIEGAKEMATPITFSILTTMAAFSPMLFTPGMIGKIQFAIPIIVILVLGISLIESFFILPVHLAHVRMLKKNGGMFSRLADFQQAISRGLERFIDSVYGPFVDMAARHRMVTVAASAGVFFATLGLITGNHVKYIDFPGGDKDEVVAQATLPYGVNVAQTEAVMQKLVDSARRTLAKVAEADDSLGILSTIGMGREEESSGSHITSVTVLLAPLDERDFSSKEFAAAWRKELGAVSGVESLGFSSTRHGLRKPIDFVISHSEIPILEKAANDVAQYLESFAGVSDVDDGVEEGKPQWNFQLTEEGANAGLTAVDIGARLRSAFYGAEALRQQRGRSEIKMMVRLPEEERSSLKTVEDLVVQTPDGGEITLAQAAHMTKDRAYKSIARTNGRRTLQIQADVLEGRANAQEVQETLFTEFLPELKQRYPGLDYGLRGRAEEFSNFRSFIVIGISMALIAIYALIAIPLKSYLQPLFVVMAAIPFGFVGAVLAHFALGMPLSMFSLMGVLALAGVVVNDSIVFVSTANQLRREGYAPYEAATQAGRRRFRPILLTTLTTFFGLTPIIVETSPEAQMLIPMAVSLGFGILIATFFVLVLVPSLFIMVEHLRDMLGRDDPADEPEALESKGATHE